MSDLPFHYIWLYVYALQELWLRIYNFLKVNNKSHYFITDFTFFGKSKTCTKIKFTPIMYIYIKEQSFRKIFALRLCSCHLFLENWTAQELTKRYLTPSLSTMRTTDSLCIVTWSSPEATQRSPVLPTEFIRESWHMHRPPQVLRWLLPQSDLSAHGSVDPSLPLSWTKSGYPIKNIKKLDQA